MERFNSWISRRIINRRFPEATVLETYRVLEFVYFLQLSGQLPYTAVSTNGIETEMHSLLLTSSETRSEKCIHWWS